MHDTVLGLVHPDLAQRMTLAEALQHAALWATEAMWREVRLSFSPEMLAICDSDLLVRRGLWCRCMRLALHRLRLV